MHAERPADIANGVYGPGTVIANYNPDLRNSLVSEVGCYANNKSYGRVAEGSVGRHQCVESGQEGTKIGLDDTKSKLKKELKKWVEILAISEAKRGTEGVKACQLAASLRGELAEVLQTLPDTERLDLNSLCNALNFGSARNTTRTTHVVDVLKEEEMQKAERMADVQDLKSALLHVLKWEAANEVICRDRHSFG
ncbi:uncharacterized protein TNCV_291641 [Trichonephila clavipes]|nr:uncharacterized protein TNCV_291641 [Trichonephila clavipes]